MNSKLVRVFQIGALAFVVLVSWGWLVREAHFDTFSEPVNRAIRGVAKFPELAMQVIRGDYTPPMRVKKINTVPASSFEEVAFGSNQYHILLTTLSERFGRATIRLVDLSSKSVVKEWTPDHEAIFDRFPGTVGKGYIDSNYPMSVVLDEDDSAVFIYTGGPLVKIDRNSEVVWAVGRHFHHSLERDADGHFWSPLRLDESPNIQEFSVWDDALARISPDGEIVYTKSVFDILVENGYEWVLASAGLQEDAVHLNDIQPVLRDGSHWMKGDVFVSIRTPSAVFQYRPATNEVLWLRVGPWLKQHDVDILDDSRISIFGNDATFPMFDRTGASAWSLKDNSNLYVVDLATDSVSTPYSEVFASANIFTKTEGRSEIQPDGTLFIDETNRGRHLLVDSVSVKWAFVEVDSDGWVFYPGWSRLLRIGTDGGFVE